MKETLKRIYDSSPPSLQKIVKFFHEIISSALFTESAKRRRWIKNVYWKFGQDQRKYIFLSIARFCHINRPIKGYYFEFGCHEANTMRQAFDTFRYLFDWIYVAFDSFEGLPEIDEIDRQDIWQKGKLKTDEKDFIRIMTRHGMPQNKLITVKGFYEQSLNESTKSKLSHGKAAVIYIDCDLYASTVPILNFIKDFLQKGTIIVFDDWNCFYGDSEKGERKAWKEFLNSNSSLIFEDFVQTNEGKAFIFLGEKSLDIGTA